MQCQDGGALPTIAQPAARAINGYVAGVRASHLALHHPDVFGTSNHFSATFMLESHGANTSQPFVVIRRSSMRPRPDVVVGRLAPPYAPVVYFNRHCPDGPASFRPDGGQLRPTPCRQRLSIYGDPRSGDATAGVRSARKPPTALEVWAARMGATGVF